MSVFYPAMSILKPSRPVAGLAVVAIALGGAGWLRAEQQHGAKKAKGAVVERTGPRSQIDWTRGLIIERGAAAGDLRAPSPAVARVAAARQARQAARARLRDRVAKLVLAGGRSVADLVAAEPAAGARLERAVERSLDLTVDYSSDGSVVLAVGLPLEAVRTALVGASSPPAQQRTDAPSAILVNASRSLQKPVLGLELAAGAERYAGPTVFYKDAKAAARDARLGPRKMRVRALRRERGLLWLAAGKGALDPARLASAREAGALVVVLLPR